MVNLTAVDAAIILLYVAGTLWVGFRAARRENTEDDFLLAGRTLTLPMFVATLVSTWYGGILGVGEFTYRYGISNWFVFGVPYYVFGLIFALVLAKRIRATNFATIPDQLQRWYGAPTAVAGGALTFILTLPAAYALMLGFLAHALLGIPLDTSVVIVTILSVVVLVGGGFRSTVAVNILQFVLMYAGFALMFVFAYSKFGGFGFVAANVPPQHLTLTGGNSWQYIIVWFFIALWTLVDPSFHQRCYAAKDERTARNGILTSVAFWFLFDFLTTSTGLFARAAVPSLAEPSLSYIALAETTLPSVAKGLFYVALIATVMSTLSSMSLIAGITFGRDIVGRLQARGGIPQESKKWTAVGLVVSSLLSIALAILFPSVVTLWYLIGTAVIPGLLIPVVASYIPALRIGGAYALAAMLGGWGVSTGSLIWGETHIVNGAPHYWFSIEPMYPGLAVAILFWVMGRIRSNARA